MSGAVVGLVSITPCAGYIETMSSIVIGGVASACVYFSIIAKGLYAPR
jgi:ammonia channel protein AmtB